MSWAAANGGVTNGGLRGVWPPVLEIGRNRPFSPFFCLFRPFPEGARSTWEIQKKEEKGLFPQISSDLLKPPSLKPPFAALRMSTLGDNRGFRGFGIFFCCREGFGTPSVGGPRRGFRKYLIDCAHMLAHMEWSSVKSRVYPELFLVFLGFLGLLESQFQASDQNWDKIAKKEDMDPPPPQKIG